MRAPLPPIDSVARALVAKGARHHAIALLEAGARRPGPDRGRCEALLGAMRARPDDRPSGPMARLDPALAEALAAHGMLPEARAVAQGARLAASGAIELTAALDQVLEDVPPSVPDAQRARWAEVVAGSLSALEQLEHEIERASGWIRARAPLAARLLRGFSVHAPTAAGVRAESAVPELPEAIRASVAERIAQRDLPGALAVARDAPQDAGGAAEIVAVLARLVVATERLMEEPQQGGATSTVPLGGHGLALFHLRMGNVAEAERGFRQIVLEQANDGLAKERLSDVSLLRRAIDPTVDVSGPETVMSGSDGPTSSTPIGWLDKRNARPKAAGWASGAPAKSPLRAARAKNEWDDEVATDVIRPEQEAELLLRSGRAERALTIYQAILRREPERAAIAARIAEIEGMLAQGRAPLPGEATVRRDSAELRAAQAARRTMPDAIEVPAEVIAAAPGGGFDEDEPTMIGARRPARADDLGARRRPSRSDDDTPLEIVTGHDAHAIADTGDPESDVVTVHRIVRID